MVEKFAESVGNPEEVKKTLGELHPLGHVGDADDVAYGLLYLASDEAKFVTGSELVIDGGYTAR
jgi:NAD(P)-dependent dehydrogenase (short-subunit alcohol dehydrogenase family)